MIMNANEYNSPAVYFVFKKGGVAQLLQLFRVVYSNFMEAVFLVLLGCITL